MNDIVMARTSLFRQPASQPASPPASQPARIRQSNNQFFPSENLVKNKHYRIYSSLLEKAKKTLQTGRGDPSQLNCIP
ncbi:hypothetical protein DPMN_008702 [Dreissena polymorpha]|uniref:Uncharacterized protein n=1 Tax=Dreissena polymorpha TaxID=45954 RepID=A0A9D4RX94_DREPO|nr:hypothetical protein DPMN_008702 [Dreissena polymorpha]